LAVHQGGEAAAEFQKIVDHRGVVQNAPIGAMAHLGLARAYSLQNDTAKARAAYNDFFTLWKDADADIPTGSKPRPHTRRCGSAARSDRATKRAGYAIST
jgi:hypothetical protein